MTKMPLLVAALVLLVGCSPPPQSAKPDISPGKVVEPAPVVLPYSSAAAASVKGRWIVHKTKNEVTGSVDPYVSEGSSAAMYNQYSSDGSERVHAFIDCDQNPQLEFGGHLVLQGTDVDGMGAGDTYRSEIRIDNQVVPIHWIILRDDDEMVDIDSYSDNTVQKLQMGHKLIVAYRAVDEGEQYATFDLTGIRTAMAKAGCQKLTRIKK